MENALKTRRHLPQLSRILNWTALISLLLTATLWPGAVSAQLFELRNERGPVGFLFGSVHGNVAGVKTEISDLISSIQRSTIVALETAEGFSIEQRKKYLGLANGATIYDILPARLTSCVREGHEQMLQASKHDVALELLVNLNPTLFAFSYLGFTLDEVAPHPQGTGYDRLIADEALKSKKIVASLESATDKADLIRRVDPADTITMLERICKLRASPTEYIELTMLYREMITAYGASHSERLTEVHRKIYRLLGASDAFVRLFWTDRNARMSDKIAGMVSHGRIPFVAVGASHIGGPDGIIALLAAQGIAATEPDHER